MTTLRGWPATATLVLSLLAAFGSAAFTWGTTTSKIDTVSKRVDAQSVQVQEHATQIADDDKRIAVGDQKLDDIIRRLGRIEDKLDHK